MIVLGGTHVGDIYARSEQEVDALIDHIMNELIQEGKTPDGFEILPERAVVSIVEGRFPEETSERWPSNYLYVSVNVKNGYGALKWWTNKVPASAPEDDISRYVWTSGNPNPPSFDPALIADPGNPSYYPREAAIPVAQVRAALEEFCRTRTGERPDCVSWLLLDQSV
ncbi:Imm1 family immunity protein [Streptomyces sp. NPDC090994]|uniref:Imm1 family immunity protein n=1 Tax=Streptomyces sp. NPDC090994 TaxID=3365969 RepID=UPI00381DC742